MNHLTWDRDRFYLDGAPFAIHSGAIHYFRVVPAYWADRLKKLRDCGFNTLETYTCWNLHERQEGQFDFSGMLDIGRYLQTAAQLGLKVILRPGPYICAEWEGGGLPGWLQRRPDLPLRCYDEGFLQAVRRYYRALFEQVRPYLAGNGGPVILVQLENEYGSYGDDKRYLRAIADIYRELGVDVPLFTADGTAARMLGGGTLPGVLAAANFGSHPRENLAALRRFKPDQPAFCGEFWCGWFDHWYEQHHTRTADSTTEDVAAMLEMDASFNLYMFHGGSNFGFWNGANHAETYQPTVTSYDYCAPLAEDGSPTDTYFALQKLLCAVAGRPLPPPPADVRHAAYGTVALQEAMPLVAALPQLAQPVTAAAPLTFAQLGLDVGYVLYRTVLEGPFEELTIGFDGLHDRAQICVDGQLRGIFERDRRADRVTLALKAGQRAQLDILVENMGRINYGPKMFDQKGILGNLRLGQRCHFGWQMWPLNMEGLDRLSFAEGGPAAEHMRAPQGAPFAEEAFAEKDTVAAGDAPVATTPPCFLRGVLRIDGAPADTFVQPIGLEKGFVCVNGFLLGRYYTSAGPQRALYLPAPLLHPGDNQLLVFETDCCSDPQLCFGDRPLLG